MLDHGIRDVFVEFGWLIAGLGVATAVLCLAVYAIARTAIEDSDR